MLHELLTEHPDHKAAEATLNDAIAARDSFDAREREARKGYEAEFEKAIRTGKPVPAEPTNMTPQQRQHAIDLLTGPVQNAQHGLMCAKALLEGPVTEACRARETEILTEVAAIHARLSELGDEARQLTATVWELRKAGHERSGHLHNRPADHFTGRIGPTELLGFAERGERFLTGEDARRRAELDARPIQTGSF